MKLTNDVKTLPAKNLKRLATYLEPEIFEALQKLAKEDKRTLSQMAAILIEEGVKRKTSEQ